MPFWRPVMSRLTNVSGASRCRWATRVEGKPQVLRTKYAPLAWAHFYDRASAEVFEGRGLVWVGFGEDEMPKGGVVLVEAAGV